MPAPRLSLAEWRLLSPRKKTLHDLHRAATHANLPLLQTPVTAKPKSLCRAILNFYGAPVSARMDLPDLIRQVAASLHAHGTKALLLDDITRLRMHRAPTTRTHST